eukprot:m.341280 g.341280  ORF g.341280 m.341280 type:complete len:3305 (+) comp16111_c0_seq3:237-10151(+)
MSGTPSTPKRQFGARFGQFLKRAATTLTRSGDASQNTAHDAPPAYSNHVDPQLEPDEYEALRAHWDHFEQALNATHDAEIQGDPSDTAHRFEARASLEVYLRVLTTSYARVHEATGGHLSLAFHPQALCHHVASFFVNVMGVIASIGNPHVSFHGTLNAWADPRAATLAAASPGSDKLQLQLEEFRAHLSVLLEFVGVVSELPSNAQTLVSAGVADHVASLLLQTMTAHQRVSEQQGIQADSSSQSVTRCLSLVFHNLLSTVAAAFTSRATWVGVHGDRVSSTKASSHVSKAIEMFDQLLEAAETGKLNLLTESSTDTVTDSKDGVASTLSPTAQVLLALHAWMLCGSNRPYSVLLAQPIRIKLVHALRDLSSYPWVLECLVALLSCITEVDDDENDIYNSGFALSIGILAHLMDPLPADDALTQQHLQSTINILHVLQRSLQPGTRQYRNMLLSADALGACVKLLYRSHELGSHVTVQPRSLLAHSSSPWSTPATTPTLGGEMWTDAESKSSAGHITDASFEGSDANLSASTELAAAALHVIAGLISDETVRTTFQATIGYDRLWDALVKPSDRAGVTTFELSLLFGMSVEETLDLDNVDAKNYTISNPDILLLLLHKLPVLDTNDDRSASPVSVAASMASDATVVNAGADEEDEDLVGHGKRDEPQTLALWVLETLSALIKRSHYNLTRCSDAKLTDSLVELVMSWRSMPEPVLEQALLLIETLGQHSIAVTPLTQLLNMMNLQSPTFRPPLYLRLHRVLQAMTRTLDPAYFIDLKGASSRISISSILPEFLSNGYTFHTWLRIDSLSSQARKVPRASLISPSRQQQAMTPQGPAQSYEPRLFAFYSPVGAGIECFFTAGRLAVRATSQGSKGLVVDTHVFTQTIIPVKNWISIALVHQAPVVSLLASRQSDLLLYINGMLCEKAPLALPLIKEPLTNCVFGAGRDAMGTSAASAPQKQSTPTAAAGASASSSVHPLSHTMSTALQAQVAKIQLFTPLSDVQLRAIHALGPDYINLYDPQTLHLSSEVHTLEEHWKESEELEARSQRRTFTLSTGGRSVLRLRTNSQSRHSNSVSGRGQRNAQRSRRIVAAQSLIANPVDDKVTLSFAAVTCRSNEMQDQAGLRLGVRGALLPKAIVHGTRCTHHNIAHVLHATGGVQAICFLLAQVDDVVKRVVDSNRQRAFQQQLDAAEETSSNGQYRTSTEEEPKRTTSTTRTAGVARAAAAAAAARRVTSSVSKPETKQVGDEGDYEIECIKLGEECVAQFFSLLEELLRTIEDAEEAMRSHLFAVISFLLNESKYAVLNVQALQSIQQLTERPSGQASFARAVYKQLLLNFELWKKSSYPTRVGHLQIVLSLVKQYTSYFRAQYGVEVFLDQLLTSTRASGSDTLSAVWLRQNLGEGEVSHLRHLMLRLVYTCIEEGATAEESKAILAFLCGCEDNTVLIDVLEDFLRCIQSSSNPLSTSLVQALLFDGPPLGLYALLQRNNDRVAVGVLTLLERVANHPAVDAAQRGVLSCANISVASFDDLFVRDAGTPVSQALIRAILKIGSHPPDGLKMTEEEGFTVVNEVSASGAGISALDTLFTRTLVCPSFVFVAAEMLSSYPVQSLVDLESITQDMLDLFDGGENVARIVEIPAWQQVFVRWLHYTTQSNIASPDQGQDGIALASLVKQRIAEAEKRKVPVACWCVLNVFAKVLATTIVLTPGGWKHVQVAITFIQRHFPSAFSLFQDRHGMSSATDSEPSTSVLATDAHARSVDATTSSWRAVPEERVVSVLLNRILELLLVQTSLQPSSIPHIQKATASNLISLFMIVEEALFPVTSRFELSNDTLELGTAERAEQARRACNSPRAQDQFMLEETLLRLADRLDILFSSDFGVLDHVLRKRVSVSSMSSLLSRRGRASSVSTSSASMAPTSIRDGGCRRITLRVVLVNLCSTDTEVCMDAVERIQVFLKDCLSECVLNSDLLYYVLFHIVSAIELWLVTPSPFNIHETMLTLFKHVLFQEAIVGIACNHVPEIEPLLVGSTCSTLEQLTALLQTPEWKALYDEFIVPTAMTVMDDTWVDRAFLALSRVSSDETWHEHASELLLAKAKIRVQSDATRLNILAMSDAICIEHWKRVTRETLNTKTARMAAARRWMTIAESLLNYQGFLEDGKDRSTRIIRHWKLDPNETLARRRPKLAPLTHFDPHREAAEARDKAMRNSAANSGRVATQDESRGDQRTPSELEPAVVETVRASVAQLSLRKGGINLREEQRATEEQDCTEKVAESDALMSVSANLIYLMDSIPGTLFIYEERIVYHADVSDAILDRNPLRDGQQGAQPTASANPSLISANIFGDFDFHIAMLRDLRPRRYNLRATALELFLMDRTNYFLDFEPGVRESVYKRVRSLRLPNFRNFGSPDSLTPMQLFKYAGVCGAWQRRELSNFEYLMALNTMAGRSFNDLNQYPVFPWIIADYTSATLNLDNPATFRDLSKPVGAISSRRAAQVKALFDDFEDPSGMTPKFHYGTHYSNAAGVLHYLLRLEPFTSLHIHLQSGRFDHADRQFHSLETTWQAIVDGVGDVKELIPEFFYLPEFLCNSSNYDLGQLQTGERVHDVILPKWAKNHHDFIQKHREALESEWVSAHLHEWIDLIFGYKQRGAAAEEALNVFYYTSYEGALDTSKELTAAERLAQEGMVREFGQTPSQLLTTPHPQRFARLEAESLTTLPTTPTAATNVFEHLFNLTAHFIQLKGSSPIMGVFSPREVTQSFTKTQSQTLCTLTASGLVGAHDWHPNVASDAGPFTLALDARSPKEQLMKVRYLLKPGARFSSTVVAASRCCQYLFVGALYDGSIRTIKCATQENVSTALGHKDVVTCLSLDRRGTHLISGSRDSTAVLWHIHAPNGKDLVLTNLVVYTGQRSPIIAAAVDAEHDMVVLGASDGTISMCAIRSKAYLRTLTLMDVSSFTLEPSSSISTSDLPFSPSSSESAQPTAFSKVKHSVASARREDSNGADDGQDADAEVEDAFASGDDGGDDGDASVPEFVLQRLRSGSTSTVDVDTDTMSLDAVSQRSFSVLNQSTDTEATEFLGTEAFSSTTAAVASTTPIRAFNGLSAVDEECTLSTQDTFDSSTLKKRGASSDGIQLGSQQPSQSDSTTMSPRSAEREGTSSTSRPPSMPAAKPSIQRIVIDGQGKVVVASSKHDPLRTKHRTACLHVFSCNGDLLASNYSDGRTSQVSDVLCSPDSKFVVTAGKHGAVKVRDAFSLKKIAVVDVKLQVTSMTVTLNQSYIILGTKDGKLVLLGAEEPKSPATELGIDNVSFVHA